MFEKNCGDYNPRRTEIWWKNRNNASCKKKYKHYYQKFNLLLEDESANSSHLVNHTQVWTVSIKISDLHGGCNFTGLQVF